MSLTEYFRLIGTSNINPGATEADIPAAETRLGGRFPDALRGWFREANGFEGEAKTNVWRFSSLQRLHTIFDVFGKMEITVEGEGDTGRRMVGSEYVIVCDALIYLPFYAVNILPGSSYYSEVLSGYDESGPGRGSSISTWFAASAFEIFEDLLFRHPDDCLHFQD